ncbi:OmpH family outer membrane protein [Cupriavidus oxalaticus]|uniref:OmpH family outer membrane protein n=1 Tax=Cupriavidus oxalaticus TaxID=96344 RepID=A0A375FJH4_9BURK|nr:OmpH family outer membrane protein [Cupriavidus oxalaticus]QRQ85873.1 OmpH family outer membrane protein [Cupriavidus oxalaticus]QRQ95801.1 OmpH family outer membrane protein [Cupriavidus oxalaticus]WQD84472.1 OmpH family outer membrane protein [Cupriavidus oxalaticus]SPC06619.1 periplasmic molecular chaperone for outer membrane proteins [Cupriavidus oxalaticus]SPC12400.1 Outer membrane chaperone Skp [Cupriavidus oxalaticus]
MKGSTPLFKSLIAGLAATAMCVTAPAQAQPARIAAVNSERILRDSQPAKRARNKLVQEFAERDRDLQQMARKISALAAQLDQDAAALGDAERQRRQREVAELDREFQHKQQAFREDLQRRRNQELALLVERANRVIRQLAEQHRYDLVVQEAVYVNPRIDITDDVIKALNASSK